MRILIVHASASPRQGGAATFLRSLCRYLNEQGVAFTVLFLEPGGLADEFRATGFDVEVIEAGRFRSIRTLSTVRAIARLIGASAASVVFSNGAHEHLYGGAAAWLAGVPALWYCHACAPGGDQTVRAASRIPAGAVLTHSEYTKALLKAGANVEARVVYPGVDVPVTEPDIAALRNELHLPHDSPVVSMVAVFMECKGQRVFIRAAARIREALPDCRFVLAGDAPFERHRPYADSLRTLVGELGLQDAMRFVGFRTDAAAIIAASDVLVHPSIEPEPFGIVLLEALARRRPVVSVATGGAGEIVGSGDVAMMVPPSDEVATAEACVTLLRDPALGRRLGAAGQARVQQRFSLNLMGRAFLQSVAECSESVHAS